MAEDDSSYDLVFGNDDSDGEFEGFSADDIDENYRRRTPEYEADGFEGDRDFESDLRFNWTREVSDPLVPPFIGDCGFSVEIERDATPIDYFSLFMKDSDFDMIATETNRYYSQIRAMKEPSRCSRMHLWYDTCGPEIRKFLGMTILMGLVDKPVLSAYWSTDSLDSTPEFAAMMQRDRFMNLLSYFHLTDNTLAPDRNQPEFDPLYKVCSVHL